jgi:hypothetical protein
MVPEAGRHSRQILAHAINQIDKMNRGIGACRNFYTRCMHIIHSLEKNHEQSKVKTFEYKTKIWKEEQMAVYRALVVDYKGAADKPTKLWEAISSCKVELIEQLQNLWLIRQRFEARNFFNMYWVKIYSDSYGEEHDDCRGYLIQTYKFIEAIEMLDIFFNEGVDKIKITQSIGKRQ